MATVTVRGRGKAVAQPDAIVVVLRVTAVHDAPAEAFADVAERTASLEGVLAELGIAETQRTTGMIALEEHHDYDSSGPGRIRHRATNTVAVQLADAGRMPELLRAAVERAQAGVQGPWWRLAEPAPARLEACRLAAEDARRRAEVYADALGLRLGAVERLTEELAHAVPAGPVYRAMAVEVPVHTPELEVDAAVDVTFRLEDA